MHEIKARALELAIMALGASSSDADLVCRVARRFENYLLGTMPDKEAIIKAMQREPLKA